MAAIHNTPKDDQMWEAIDSVLGPLGVAPDRASVDNGQIWNMYKEITKPGCPLRELVHILNMRNDAVRCILEKLVN